MIVLLMLRLLLLLLLLLIIIILGVIRATAIHGRHIGCRAELVLTGTALIVDERVLQRALGRLVQLVVELCLRVRVLIVCLVRGGRVSAKGQRRRVPYLRVDIDRG